MEITVVAVVGMCGSGKSEITRMFAQKGYHRIHFGEITMREIQSRGLSINESNEKQVREELRKKYGLAAYARLALPDIEKAKTMGPVVLDGLYSWSEFKLLKEKYRDSLIILAVVANKAVRQCRLARRDYRALAADEVDARDYAEIENLEKGGPIANADYFITNNASFASLETQFDDFLKWIGSQTQKDQ